MPSPTTVPFLVRGAIVALLIMVVGGLLTGPAGLSRESQSAEAALPREVKRLIASDAEGGDYFGHTVAISGDTGIVGSSRLPRSAGAAHIFERDEGGTGNWDEMKMLTNSDAQAFDGFGSSVAISDDTAVVGSRDFVYARGAPKVGAAYIFERDEGGADNWGEVTKLTASDAQPGDFFGRSVAVSGDTAVVGGNEAAYVLERDQGGKGSWGEVKKLLASDAQAGAAFGARVSISGDTAVVGALNDGVGGTRPGAAYVFQRNQGGADNWGEVKKLTASDARPFDMFGLSVAVSGDTAVVGSINDAEGNLAGAAYVFHRNQGGADNWGEVKKLTSFDLQAGDLFGDSVAVSGDTAVVGALHEDAGATAAGVAYVFERDQGGHDNWGEVQRLTSFAAQHYGQFGQSVAVSGDTVLVGADSEDTGGAAYVFYYDQGGIAELPGADATSRETDGSSRVYVGIAVAVAASAVGLGGVAWYARRRRL